MPFVESSQSLRSRLHVSRTAPLALAGICALALLVLFFAAGNILSLFEGERAVVLRKAEGQADAQSSAAESASSSSSQAQGGSEASQQRDASDTRAAAAQSQQPQQIYVFVSGAVASPGVYALDPDARVVDALDAAGGFSEGAATDAVNLARVLADGEQVAIPTIEQVEQGSFASAGQGSEAQAAPEAQGSALPSSLVSINSASESELEQLPGIGPATASKIVASRQQEGPFENLEDLMRVSGIGEKKFEAIKDSICL